MNMEHLVENDAVLLTVVTPHPRDVPPLRAGEDPRPARCSGAWCGGVQACPPCPIPPESTDAPTE